MLSKFSVIKGFWVFVALSLLSSLALAQDAGFAEELQDFGVPATKYPRSKSAGYGAPTPSTIPGAKVVTTKDLISMLSTDKRLIVVAAYPAKSTIAGGPTMDSAGEERLLGPDRDKFEKGLVDFTEGDKARAVVFYCHSPKCWLSYNASLHAVELGYANVLWYRGGRDAWKEADQKFKKPAGS